ncbi:MULTISPECIES: aspartoacylase [Aphanothece]|uniref:aspartoacylase n=1 Tax=Aphanothece TaxID=1121 RepID=UPI0039854DAF
MAEEVVVQVGQGAGVLVVGGTHGNERNAPWLLEHWRDNPGALATGGLPVRLILGNPEAHACNRRYVARDLNRCFTEDLLADPDEQSPEVRRARHLLAVHGPAGREPCAVAIDLHSTTSAMGNSLVLYGRRPTDLALAAGIQGLLGLPIYLHEADLDQTGFLVEQWPCGVAIEVGPVPQGVVQAQICRQSQLALEAALAVLAAARRGGLRLPAGLTVHRHLTSLDLPRGADGSPQACIHPSRQFRDWWPLQPGDPLFLTAAGDVIRFEPQAELQPRLSQGLENPEAWSDQLVAVFINEAAYGEKGIALSLARREVWAVERAWGQALGDCAAGLAVG